MGTYVSNHRETVTTEVGEFSIKQRNVGFAENDGKWTVWQRAELYWNFGVLYKRREGLHLGVVDTREEALELISKATPQPVVNVPVR